MPYSFAGHLIPYGSAEVDPYLIIIFVVAVAILAVVAEKARK